MADASLVSQGAGKRLDYPFDAPEVGETIEVAPGVHWLRMPLPFNLDHINLWLLEDGDGWTVVDTGLRGGDTREVWTKQFGTVMGGKPITRMIVTHLHPDHVGSAGWLERQFGCRLWMSRTDYLQCRMLWHDTGREAPEAATIFYRAAGYTENQIEQYKSRFGGFGKGVDRMPDAYTRVQEGDVLSIGGRDWHVVVGSGHAPEHLCLWAPEHDLFISGDQVLPRISSNVSVWPTEPDGDPLSAWIDSCHKIKATVPDTVLVCPAHQRAFHGLHHRLDQLVTGHERNLDNLLKKLAEPQRAVDVFACLYKRAIGEDLLGMATGESLAHLNCLLRRGLATRSRDEAGVDWYHVK